MFLISMSITYSLRRVVKLDNGLTALLISDTLRRQKRNSQTVLDEEIHRNSNEVESDSECETSNEDSESDMDGGDSEVDDGYDDDHLNDHSDVGSDDENSFNNHGNKRVHRKDVISSNKKETKLVSLLKTCDRNITKNGFLYFSIDK